jgi:cell division protein FtsB
MPVMFNSKVATGILAGLCVWLGLLAVTSHLRHATMERELATLQDRISASRKENDQRAAELERIRQPSWLALLARTRLNYILPGEAVVFVYKSEKPGTISPPLSTPDARSNWRKWYDWLRAR